MAKRKKRKVAKKQVTGDGRFHYCSACGSRRKINNVCQVCGSGRKNEIAAEI